MIKAKEVMARDILLVAMFTIYILYILCLLYASDLFVQFSRM